MRSPIIAPSILSADFANMQRSVDAVAGADWLHVDIMDNHFVPNLTFGVQMTKAVASCTDIPLDVHLMIENPERWVGDYIDAGAYTAVFHYEAAGDAVALARDIRSASCRAGVSIKPGTPVDDIVDHLDEFDEVLVMSVEPGFGGQAFMPEVLTKVQALRAAIDRQAIACDINIDGGISRATIGQAAAAGCDAFVAGSAIFGAPDVAAEIVALRELAAVARR